MTQKRKNSPASPRSGGAASAPAMVRRSTLYVSVVAALLFGLYMGTLIPTLMGTSSATQGASGAASNAEAMQEDAQHIADAESAASADPTDAEKWIHLGNLYFDAGQAEKSVMAYTKALEINPNNANVLTDRGTMYRELKKFDLALQSYRQANKADPRHENSLFNAGVVLYFDLNRKAEAKETWQQLVRMNPNAKAPNGQSVKDMLLEM